MILRFLIHNLISLVIQGIALRVLLITLCGTVESANKESRIGPWSMSIHVYFYYYYVQWCPRAMMSQDMSPNPPVFQAGL